MELYLHKLMEDIDVDDIQWYHRSIHNDDNRLPKNSKFLNEMIFFFRIFNSHSNVHPNDIEHN
jgi:hypothetical protein